MLLPRPYHISRFNDNTTLPWICWRGGFYRKDVTSSVCIVYAIQVRVKVMFLNQNGGLQAYLLVREHGL